MKRVLTVAFVLLGAASAGSLPAAVGQTAQGARVTVAPRTGDRSSEFLVSFTAPDRSGRSGWSQRGYEVSAEGGSKGCNAAVGQSVAAVKAGQRAHVLLGPSQPSGWCTGSYHGKVVEWEQPWCAPGQVCPAFVSELVTLGTFSFTVRRALPDTTAPSFSGLRTAWQCFPGPYRPSQNRPVFLRWRPASDDVTPPDKIVYDVYMSPRSGGEDFSRPLWVTRGTLSHGWVGFSTPPLAPGGYFVVRARDQYGHEDRNRVERAVENPCVGPAGLSSARI